MTAFTGILLCKDPEKLSSSGFIGSYYSQMQNYNLLSQDLGPTLIPACEEFLLWCQVVVVGL